MENNRLREIAKEFCEKYEGTNENELYNFLADNQWKIYADYQKKSLHQTIYYELECRDFEASKVPEHIIDDMAVVLEERVFDEDRFCDIINNVIDDYAEDLQEYAVED